MERILFFSKKYKNFFQGYFFQKKYKEFFSEENFDAEIKKCTGSCNIHYFLKLLFQSLDKVTKRCYVETHVLRYAVLLCSFLIILVVITEQRLWWFIFKKTCGTKAL